MCSVESSHSVLLWGLYKVFKSCSSQRHINSHVLFIRAGGCVCGAAVTSKHPSSSFHTHWFPAHTHAQRLCERERERERRKTALQDVHQEHLVDLMVPKLHAGTHTFKYTKLSFLKRTVFQIKSWSHGMPEMKIRLFQHKNNLIRLFQHFYCWKSSRCGNESEPCAMQRVVLRDLWRTGRTDSSSRSPC